MVRVPADRSRTHPGEPLLEELVGPMGIQAEEIANVIRASLSELEPLVQGRRPLDSEEAARLSEYLGTDPAFCMSL
jgi:addiction module HigA family antidote